ncbi:hypothetical protein [Vreelandella malpeensis]|uniref:Uncharacterized protein n=1 Tax=Vreelandella malpeensis TaxID=1172368 RepID=A0ABS8DQ37_9GAMM|nr:hypothetical protein [Halomonas malpeensis]MCB8888148.1 hypothetical protein [Halomonas malpeensis]
MNEKEHMMSNEHDQKKSDEASKAKKLVDRDTDSSAPSRKGATSGAPAPYRPDENVDNQKKHSSTPAHNTSMKSAPFPGAQVVKEKKAHKENIDRQSDEADPKGSE